MCYTVAIGFVATAQFTCPTLVQTVWSIMSSTTFLITFATLPSRSTAVVTYTRYWVTSLVFTIITASFSTVESICSPQTCVQAFSSLISRCAHTISRPYITSYVIAVCRTSVFTVISILSQEATIHFNLTKFKESLWTVPFIINHYILSRIVTCYIL